MPNYIMITILVESFDDTISFYTNKLDFEIDLDNELDGLDRWIVLKHKNNKSIKLSLKLAKPDEAHLVGNQTGSQRLFNLHTENLFEFYKTLEQRKVIFEKANVPYADFAYLKDNNGNSITLSEYWVHDW